MNSDRIKQLYNFLEQTPEDPFLKYALALEYKTENKVKAAQFFEQLLESHPKYLPTYFHAAEFFAELDQETKAKEIYENGIALAQSQEDQHALAELQNAYQNFLIEFDLF